MNKKRVVKGLICIMICIVCLSSCKSDDIKEDRTYIYCINADKTGLYPIEFEFIDEESPIDSAQRILEELKKPSEDIKYLPSIPKNVSINDLDIKGQIITVDFSRGYLEIPNINEKLTRAAVVQSLVKINGIRGVIFTVEGNELYGNDSEPTGIMTEDDFVKNIGFSVSSYVEDRITLYFANSTGDKIVPITMDVKYSTNMPKEKLIVEKLIKGIKKTGCKSILDPRVGFLSVTTKDDICYVNFDEEFLTSPIDVKPDVVIYSIVNSIIEGTGAKAVQFTVNGEKNIVYKEKIDLTQPFYINYEIIEREK